MEECFVYVLGCAGPSRYLTYVGWTLDLDRRLSQHNAGTGRALDPRAELGADPQRALHQPAGRDEPGMAPEARPRVPPPPRRQGAGA